MALRSDQEKCAHLLRRFGLGASEAEVQFYLGGGGINSAVERLLAYDKQDEGFNLDINGIAPVDKKLNMPIAIGWWIARLVRTQRPLQERMTLFWHNHFATSAEKVKAPGMMVTQNETLRTNATGNFRALLMQVSQDPAMIFWLDNEYNVKGKANENFAREVMELFTLGIGNYSEQDIQQSARAFTGWTLKRNQANPGYPAFRYNERAHDYGEKTFFGRTGNFGGEDIINMLCDNPRTSQFITQKLWKMMVYPDPSPEVVNHFAGVFRDSGLELKALLRAIMTSDEFYSEKAERAIYKSPVDFVVASARQLGLGGYLLEAGNIRRIQPMNQALKGMGMQLMYPPDVSGWEHGQAWVTTATMVERIAWADRLFGGRDQRPLLEIQAYDLYREDPTPSGVARKLVSIFDAPLPDSKIQQLRQAAEHASGGRLGVDNANATSQAVARLIFASPEFQLC
ncbi:MAG: DUF1800 domain-containing protein [Armatimonadetes bacterium]|nr:DUF1800 domain-containing protein [Armatimonadota bacterium]